MEFIFPSFYRNIVALSIKSNIDPIIFKSLIAQESNFNPKANNASGFAGLTQIGGAAIQDAGLNIGATKKVDGNWQYDFDGDERFKPEKSINGGAQILRKKIAAVDLLIFSKYPQKPDETERMKFYLAAYNAGEGTVLNAVKLSGITNPTWDGVIKKQDKEKSGLWNAINISWGREKKYEEITNYVDQILSRRNQ